MTIHEIKGNYIGTIDWIGGGIIDWGSGATFYRIDGASQELGTYHYAYDFDAAITSADGQYAFVYERLGTKGLLLKNGDLLREINRSYYHAQVYEYPAAFVTVDDKTYLVHCPVEYCQLDFEDVVTGELVTNVPGRNASDIFHSRLLVSPDNKSLVSRGWVWHPVETLILFDVAACLQDPLLLDHSLFSSPDAGIELNTADFVDNDRLLIGALSGESPFDEEVVPVLPPYHMAVWDFKQNKIHPPVKAPPDAGNLFVINERLAWDMYKYPKIIDLATGEVVDKAEHIHSGEQHSSIISGIEKLPQIRFDRQSGRIAMKVSGELLLVLTPDE